MFRRIALFLIVAAACDPLANDGGDEAAPWTPYPPKVAVEPTQVPGSAPADRDSLGGFLDCLRRCDAPGLTRAARAECRYRCEDIEGPRDAAAPSPVAVDPVMTVMHCMTRCPGHGERSFACMDACERLGTDSPVSPSALDELGTCITECHTVRRLQPKDRPTCEIDCAEAARTAGPDRRGQP